MHSYWYAAAVARGERAHKHVQACVVDDADGTGAVGRAQKPSQ